MDMAGNKADVSTPSPRMAELEGKRQLCRALLSGTEGMVAAGKTWLPQHPGESDGNFRVRLTSNTLTNFLEQAISKANGRIFAKGIKTKDIPPAIEPLLENIDLQGRNLDSFAMDVFKSAWADGISYILIDEQIPAIPINTAADRVAAKIRPYAVHITAGCILEIMSEMIDGVQTIARVRIKECNHVPDGEWGYVEQTRVRVLMRRVGENGKPTIFCQMWKEEEKQGSAGKEWVMDGEEVATAMKRIALVPIYTNRVGYMEGEPPFQATAELNLDHWRVKSEQKNALTMNCFEMLSATGVDEDWVAKVGPAQVQRASNPDAKFAYLSPTGKGVELAGQYLKDIEAQIESAGASLRVENAGNVSATAAALDSEEGIAAIKAIAEAGGDALELAVGYMAELMALPLDVTGDIELSVGGGARKGTDAGLQELGKARLSGDISRKAYLTELIRRDELSENFDMDENEDELTQDGPSLATLSARTQGDI